MVLLLFGIFQWKWLGDNLKLLFWVIVASVSADAISLILINQGITTWPVINLFFFIQFWLLFKILNEPGKVEALRFLFLACIAFSLMDFLFIQGPQTFNSYATYASGILIIILALRFLYQLLTEMPVAKVQTLPLFWLAFGVLLYYGGNLFLFLFNNYLIAHLPKHHESIWQLHNILNISKNVFFFVTLWINYKSKTSPS